jgi:CDP-4-dehydro-6-deoxyglucose reductase
MGEGEHVLTAALSAGIRMPYGCRRGTCRSCVGRILEGKVAITPGCLRESDVAAGVALLCQTTPLSDLVIDIVEAPEVTPPKVGKILVKAMSLAAPDVMVLDMRLPITSPLFFAAGQFIDVILPGGKRRSYSLATAPQIGGDVDLRLHVRRVAGGLFSEHVFTRMRARELLLFEGPLGACVLREDGDRPIVLVAGGTGYAPIRSIIEASLKRGTGRRMTLYWGCRSRQDLYLAEEPVAWAAAHPNFSFIPVLSEPRPGDGWGGRVGPVHEAVMDDLPDLSACQAYVCGAPAMVSAARAGFIDACGLPRHQFFAESFFTEADSAASPSVVS